MGTSHAHTYIHTLPLPLSLSSIYTHTYTTFVERERHMHMIKNMESWKPKVTKSKQLANAPNCKKHPKHTQSPGVCSICLAEKLSQLSNSTHHLSSSRSVYSSSSSSSSSVSSLTSSEASSCSSPMGTRVFSKSRSMAFVSQQHHDIKKISGGFWSKLLPNRKLMHSTTMHIERAVTAVH